MKFLFKLCSVILLLFLGVLIGLQQANEGLKTMKGYEDPRFANAVTLNEEDGLYEASFLGNDVGEYNLEEKKKELEQMKAYNFFSNMGKNISEGISSLTQKILSKIE